MEPRWCGIAVGGPAERRAWASRDLRSTTARERALPVPITRAALRRGPAGNEYQCRGAPHVTVHSRGGSRTASTRERGYRHWTNGLLACPQRA